MLVVTSYKKAQKKQLAYIFVIFSCNAAYRTKIIWQSVLVKKLKNQAICS